MQDYITIKRRTARRGCLAAIAVLAAAVAGTCLYRHAAPHDNGTAAPTDTVCACNTLTADGRPVIHFGGIGADSCFTQLSPSPRIISCADTLQLSAETLRRIVTRTRARIRRQTARLDSVNDEMRYYLEVHSVQDEGFGMISAHAESVKREYRELLAADSLLGSIGPNARLGVSRTVIPGEAAPRENTSGEAASHASASRHDNSFFVAVGGGVWQGGRWMKTAKNGRGLYIGRDGRAICGTWHADTLATGRLTDSLGTYRGQFDSTLSPSGHGSHTAPDGTFYEGRWQGGRRHGFGFEVGTSRLRAGEWEDGRYRGERMIYTSERIYGIDISRYQHGKGRKYYPIHWNRLRITHLGKADRRRTASAEGYPVSFVYIKSTEGVSIRNPHYRNDYLQARRHGLRCGAYHFFSTKTGAAAQARYFIRHSLFRRGDFPPVLDVEPTHAQIMKMGGRDALLDAIRTWMRIVGRHTGVRPILYVSQTFVNRYLADASDIKRDYNIWIARYGEYRPDVKLIYWQLCPDGRINGIHGDVDINVFNGYRDRYDTFLETELIK